MTEASDFPMSRTLPGSIVTMLPSSTSAANAPAPGTPDWWLRRLTAQLKGRSQAVNAADDWYTGNHPSPAGYDRAREVLRRLLEAANANFMALVVDAAVERMHVEGFRLAGSVADEPWRIWQANSFDLGAELVLIDCLALGEASVLVDPTLNAAGTPTLTPEHPSQTTVAYVPGSFRDRAAGLKLWTDDMDAARVLMAAIYLPDRVVTYAAPLPRSGVLPNAPKWEVQPSLSGLHGLGEVPLVPFPNRPRMLKPGTAEFATVVPIQRRINKTILDRLVMQEFGAFKQKWVTGMEVPVDPETGQPIEPFVAAIDRLLVSESSDATFGQFESEDIASLLAAVDSDVKQIAAIVPTPPHYLLGNLVNLSAEALKAAEAALVSRIRRHMRHVGEPLEAVVRLSLRAAGKSSPDVVGMETIWRNPEFRTEGELVDALVKMAGLGVPVEALWERWGATPQEITSWKAKARSAALTAAAGANLAAFVNPPGGAGAAALPGANPPAGAVDASGLAGAPGGATVR